MAKIRNEQTWRYLVRAVDPQAAPFPNEMRRIDACEILGAATVDTGIPIRDRRPWLVMFSRTQAPTVSMWERRHYEVAPMRLLYPGGDPENGAAEWHARVGGEWLPVEFSTVQRPAS